MPQSPPATAPFVMSRTLAAPQALVFAAFTEAERMKHWWGPKSVTVVQSNMDLRPGGSYHYCMRTADGQDMWGKFAFLEVVAPERLELLNSFSDANGGLTRHPMAPTWPAEMFSRFTFTEQNGATLFEMLWSPHNASAEEIATFDKGRDGMQAGWTGTLDQLDAYLKEIQKS